MENSILFLKKKEAFLQSIGAEEQRIIDAENILNLKFSKDYREYLGVFGYVSFFGHELTGLGKDERRNVVSVTEEERRYNPEVPLNWYVIEQTHFDDIVIWQSEDGDIYETMPGVKAKKIADSLAGYCGD